jgi:hypothetical protein
MAACRVVFRLFWLQRWLCPRDARARRSPRGNRSKRRTPHRNRSRMGALRRFAVRSPRRAARPARRARHAPTWECDSRALARHGSARRERFPWESADVLRGRSLLAHRCYLVALVPMTVDPRTPSRRPESHAESHPALLGRFVFTPRAGLAGILGRRLRLDPAPTRIAWMSPPPAVQPSTCIALVWERPIPVPTSTVVSLPPTANFTARRGDFAGARSSRKSSAVC